MESLAYQSFKMFLSSRRPYEISEFICLGRDLGRSLDVLLVLFVSKRVLDLPPACWRWGIGIALVD